MKRYRLYAYSVFYLSCCPLRQRETKIVFVLSISRTVRNIFRFVSYGKLLDKRLPVEFTATDSEPDAAVLQLNSTLDSPPNFPLRM